MQKEHNDTVLCLFLQKVNKEISFIDLFIEETLKWNKSDTQYKTMQQNIHQKIHKLYNE